MMYNMYMQDRGGKTKQTLRRRELYQRFPLLHVTVKHICNLALGLIDDNIDTLRSMIRYLRAARKRNRG